MRTPPSFVRPRQMSFVLWLSLAWAMFYSAGCQMVVVPEPSSATAQTTPATSAVISSSVETTATVAITPVVEATAAPEVAPPPDAKTIVTVTTAVSEEEALANYFPPGSEIVGGEDLYLFVQTPHSLEETESYFLEEVDERTILLERLWSPLNEYGGESFFLLFWHREEDESSLPSAGCIYGFEEIPAASVVYLVRGECNAVGTVAEGFRRAPWNRPADEDWVTWENEEVTFDHPGDWQPDEEFFAGSHCQSPDARCLVALRRDEQTSLERISLVVQPRQGNMEPMDYGQAMYAEMQQNPLGFQLLTTLPVSLETGEQATQDIYLYFTQRGTPAVQYTIHAVTEDNYYMITGSAISLNDELAERYAVVSAIGRSVQLHVP